MIACWSVYAIKMGNPQNCGTDPRTGRGLAPRPVPSRVTGCSEMERRLIGILSWETPRTMGVAGEVGLGSLRSYSLSPAV